MVVRCKSDECLKLFGKTCSFVIRNPKEIKEIKRQLKENIYCKELNPECMLQIS